MIAPRVWNYRRGDVPDDAVDITRRSEWGNWFRVKPGRNRARSIAEHKAWLLANPKEMEKVRRELRGRDLVCWCKPRPCHGDILLWVANLDDLV